MGYLILFVLYFFHFSHAQRCQDFPRGPMNQSKCPLNLCAWDCLENKCVQHTDARDECMHMAMNLHMGAMGMNPMAGGMHSGGYGQMGQFGGHTGYGAGAYQQQSYAGGHGGYGGYGGGTQYGGHTGFNAGHAGYGQQNMYGAGGYGAGASGMHSQGMYGGHGGYGTGAGYGYGHHILSSPRKEDLKDEVKKEEKNTDIITKEKNIEPISNKLTKTPKSKIIEKERIRRMLQQAVIPSTQPQYGTYPNSGYGTGGAYPNSYPAGTGTYSGGAYGPGGYPGAYPGRGYGARGYYGYRKKRYSSSTTVTYALLAITPFILICSFCAGRYYGTKTNAYESSQQPYPVQFDRFDPSDPSQYAEFDRETVNRARSKSRV